MYIYERIEEILSYDVQEVLRTKDLLLKLININNVVFKGCPICNKDLIKSYNRLKNEGLNTMRQQEIGKFLLKGIIHFTNGKTISNANLTDEMAIQIIANNEIYVRQFIRIPDNWKELVEEYNNKKNINNKLIEAGVNSTNQTTYYFVNKNDEVIITSMVNANRLGYTIADQSMVDVYLANKE